MSETRELSTELVKTDEVIGRDVLSTTGEKLGKIEEIVLEKKKGVVRYVVLSFGGILGLGDKLFALPWTAISFDPVEEAFILAIDKEKLKKAPGFDKDIWPNMADQKFGEAIFTYYGQKPYWM